MVSITSAELRINPTGDNQQEVIVNTTVRFSAVEIALMKALRKEHPRIILLVVTCDIMGSDRNETRFDDGIDDYLFRIPSRYFPLDGIESIQNLEFTMTVPTSRLNETRYTNRDDKIYALIKVHDQYTGKVSRKTTNIIIGGY